MESSVPGKSRHMVASQLSVRPGIGIILEHRAGFYGTKPQSMSTSTLRDFKWDTYMEQNYHHTPNKADRFRSFPLILASASKTETRVSIQTPGNFLRNCKPDTDEGEIELLVNAETKISQQQKTEYQDMAH